jgi:GTPase SAR1 family protein
MEPVTVISTIFELAGKALINNAGKALINDAKNKIIGNEKLSEDGIIKLAEFENTDDYFSKKYLNNLNVKEKIKFLLDNEKNIFHRIISQLKPVNHRGVMFLGPSGAGKTTLVNAFINGQVIASKKSTTGIVSTYTRVCNEIVCIRDTAGKTQHEDNKFMLVDECLRYPPNILCLVLAGSYLETKDAPDLQRDYESTKFENIRKYLEYTKKEEISWIESFINRLRGRTIKLSKPVNNILIVANKMDLWGDKYNEVKESYINNSKIKELANILTNSHNELLFEAVSSNYDSFLDNQAPINGFSHRQSQFSVLLLRANIGNLLKSAR